jgi:putative DNA primase/helicase
MADFTLSTETEAFFGARRARLLRFNNAWLTYEPGGFYREISEEVLRADIRRANAEHALKSTAISNALDEIKSATVIDSHGAEVPLWLCDASGALPASRLIVCRNGILESLTATLYPHSDALLTFNALPYDYAPNAPAPARWLSFLAEVFDGDAEAIGELQKLFGYLLTGDTSLQKIFAVIGPTRSGKGTIGRVLEALIGKPNICGPSFHKIGGDFGLQSFIGKQIAIIADARLGHRTDKVIVAERLLSISGEDSLDIARKGVADWHGRLNTRLLILSNELPALPDPSGALAARFVAFHTPNSFLGREDRTLTDKLRGELPGILNWSLEGMRRLAIEGRIVTPVAARDLIEGIETLGSPVKAFVADMCTLTPDGNVIKDELWATYRGWHVANGIPGAPLSREMFARAIKTAYAGRVKDYRPRGDADTHRPRYWSGVALRGPGSVTHANYVPPFGPGVVPLRSG